LFAFLFLLIGSNRTIVGLKLAKWGNLLSILHRSNRTIVGLKPGQHDTLPTEKFPAAIAPLWD